MRLVSWKFGNALAMCGLAIVIGQIAAPITGSARAIQDQRKPEQTTPPAPKGAQGQPQTPAPTMVQSPFVEAPSRPPGPNVRVEITITDQAGSNTPVKKTLSVIAHDRYEGSIRSKVTVVVPGRPVGEKQSIGYEELPLNVDIRAEVMDNGLIRTRLILNYETVNPGTELGTASRSIVTANQMVMLENGKPMIVSQSADAATDRKVTVELKATVLR
jgi:hypothetical protein